MTWLEGLITYVVADIVLNLVFVGVLFWLVWKAGKNVENDDRG